MGFLDNTGLARLWEHINSLLGSRIPATRTINGKALTSDITLNASDVGAIATSLKGAANGVAELDSTGKVPTAQLPSYVDDVLEYSTKANFPTTGETGKIYVDIDAKKTYRWSGSTYTEISASLALGTTSSTAYYGDKGAAAYAHAVTNKGIAKSNGLYKITTNSEGHVTAATAVVKADITALGVPAQDTTYSAATTSAAGLMSAADKTRLDTLTDDYIISLINTQIALIPRAEEAVFGGS